MTWYGSGSGSGGGGTPGGATAANQPAIDPDGGADAHITNLPPDQPGLAKDSTVQALLTSVQTALMPVIAHIPATDGMTSATLSGVTLPALWNLFINGQQLSNGTDYTVSQSGDTTTITFLPAMGYAIAATDLIVIEN